MRNSARRTVGGARFSLAQPTVQATPTEEPRVPDVSSPTSGQQQQNQTLETGRIMFNEIALAVASEMAIRELDDSEEVMVLMPAMEFVIAHGPKRTVLYWLCRDAGTTENINDYLEGEMRVL